MSSNHVATRHARLAAAAVALIVGACTGSGGAGSPAPSTVPVAVSSLQATSVPAPTDTLPPSGTPEPTKIGTGPQPTAGSLDPCTLITQAEASGMIGKALGPGVSSTAGPDRVCTFKSGLSEVKLILAPPAPSLEVATSYWDAERSQVPAGISITDLPNFDRSAYGNGSSAGLSISALFVISGTTFFDLFCGFPACTSANEVDVATNIVSRLP